MVENNDGETGRRSDDWIELHTLIPGNPEADAPPSPAPPRPPPPRLHLDTSNLEPHDEEKRQEGNAPPQSAILGLANQQTRTGIDAWLPAQESKKTSAGLSPSRAIPSTPLEQRRPSASSVSPRRRRSTSGLSPRRSPQMAGDNRTRSSLSIPRLVVQKSFRSGGLDDTLAGSDEESVLMSDIDVAGESEVFEDDDDDSSSTPNRRSPSPSPSPTRPRRLAALSSPARKKSTGHHLTLSGAAYATQLDILDAEDWSASAGESDLDDLTEEVDRVAEKEQFDAPNEPIGRTLGYFYPNQPLRRFLYKTMVSGPMRAVWAVLTLLQIVTLVVEMHSPLQQTNGLSRVSTTTTTSIFIALYSVYTLLAVSSFIAFGAVTNEIMTRKEFLADIWWLTRRLIHFLTLGALKAPSERPARNLSQGTYRCFLRTSWGRVELVSLIFFWIYIGLSINRTIESLVLIIAGLAHIRVLRLLDLVPYTQVILHLLKVAIPLLQNVLVFIAFFLVVYGIIGLQSFHGSLRRVCVYEDIITSQHCGSWLNPTTFEKMPYMLLDHANGSLLNQTTSKGYTCPAGSQCVELRAFPDGGSYSSLAGMSFDNIFNSLEIVFIMMSNNSFTDIMYKVVNAEYLVSSLFFISGVLVLGIWLMNLLVAVMVSSYAAVRDMLQELSIWTPELLDKLWNWSPFKHDLEGQTLEENKDHGKWILESTVWGRRYMLVYPLFSVLALADLIYQAAAIPPHHGLFGWEIGLCVAFGIEILVRFFVYLPYWRYFFLSIPNSFDLVLAIANAIILPFHKMDETYAWLTVFQLLRVYRLIGALKYSRIFWVRLFGNTKVMASLTAFYFITTFLCTLVACKMLRGQFPMETDGELNIHSFYDLSPAFFDMYQVASTENWTDVLFYTTENVSRPGDNVVGLACMGILFCGWLFFANFLIFNLFIGVMSENLHGGITNKREQQVKQFATDFVDNKFSEGPIFKRLATRWDFSDDQDADVYRPVLWRDRLKTLLMRFRGGGAEDGGVAWGIRQFYERKFVFEFLGSHGGTSGLAPADIGNARGGFTFLSLQTEGDNHAQTVLAAHPYVQQVCRAVFDLLKRAAGLLHHYPRDYRTYLANRIQERHNEAAADPTKAYVEEIFDYHSNTMNILEEYCATHPGFDRPLFIFEVDNPIRIFFQRLFPSSYGPRRSRVYPGKWVGLYVKLLFMAATVALVIETCVNTPLKTLKEEENNQKWTTLHLDGLIFGTLFTAEFAGKVIADGFHFTPNAYTSSQWNWLDLIALISIWMTFINDAYGGPVSRYIRALTALRALRLISMHGHSERLFNSVFVYGFKNIVAAAIIALSLMIPYAVWGKNIFHNRLDQCNDSNVDYNSACLGEYSATLFEHFDVLSPRVVQGQYFSYDHFWSALFTQFSVLSLEGWIDVLQAVTSISGPDQQPDTYVSKWNAIYPIVYHYIGSVLILTMFVAVIIQNFSLSMGTAFLTEEQLSWLDVKNTLKLVTPTPRPPRYPPNSLRYRLLRLIPTWITAFEMWALLVVTVDMLTYFYPLSKATDEIYGLILLACSMLLVCLSVLRLIILKPRLFVHNWWNPFGLIVCVLVVILSILDMALPGYAAGGSRNASRAACICLLLLWIPRSKRLYQFYTIATAAFAEIAVLLWTWFTLYIAYAIALNQTFGLTKFGSESTSVRNFRTVPKALIALFTMSCGEGWNEFLMDFTIEKPYCVETSKKSECGITGFAYFLFVSWNLVSMYVFANLFVSLICEACWYVYRSGPVNITEHDIVNFLDAWQEFDPKGTGYIRPRDIYDFLGRTQGYFSIGIYSNDPKYNVRRILSETNAEAKTLIDSYDVNMDAINAYLETMPVARFCEKRTIYEMFTTQARMLAEDIPGGRGIQLFKLMQMFPLYLDMNPSEVLTLKEFISLKIQLQEARLALAVSFVARRWRARRRRPASRETPGVAYIHDVGAPHEPREPVYWVN